MRKMMFAAGIAVGYVLGARAGRERYEQLTAAARRVRQNQTVRDATSLAQDQAAKIAYACRERMGDSRFGIRSKSSKSQGQSQVPPPQYWETAGGNPSSPTGQNIFRI